MRKIYEIGIILIMISGLFTGCNHVSKVEELERSNQALQVEKRRLEEDNTRNEDQKTRVYVEEYGSMPPSRNDPNTLFFKGIGEGEYLELKVEGKITNLRSVRVEFIENEEGEFNFVDKEEIIHADKVENQTVIIETVFPCGIPSANVRWDDEEGGGNLVLAYDGKDGMD